RAARDAATSALTAERARMLATTHAPPPQVGTAAPAAAAAAGPAAQPAPPATQAFPPVPVAPAGAGVAGETERLIAGLAAAAERLRAQAEPVDDATSSAQPQEPPGLEPAPMPAAPLVAEPPPVVQSAPVADVEPPPVAPISPAAPVEGVGQPSPPPHWPASAPQPAPRPPARHPRRPAGGGLLGRLERVLWRRG
ncbi:MAG: hypothetical protein LT070_12500, partial [Solirubrobacteraceae bacterium]|nr:hypothetical protein [Solirubrobacteraceae bacterium]